VLLYSTGSLLLVFPFFVGNGEYSPLQEDEINTAWMVHYIPWLYNYWADSILKDGAMRIVFID